MWQVWTSNHNSSYSSDYLYDTFKTLEEAQACRDDYNEWADHETFAYVVPEGGN